jgi:hypothetical protein
VKNKRTKTSKSPDLRKGILGSVTVDDNFVGRGPVTDLSDLEPASPALAVPVGQTTKAG